MCDFFGVSKLAEISADHFAFVVTSRHQEIEDHRRAMQLRQQPPRRIQTPTEAARELAVLLAKLSPADPALAQAQLQAAVSRSHQIVEDAAAHGWDVAVVPADDDAEAETSRPSTRH